jgi:tetratricopeptide (TPR) repeat protein
MRAPLIFALFFALFQGLPLSATPVDPFQDPLIASIHERHQRGVEGDKGEVKSLVIDLEKLIQEHPQNSLLLAYLGSAYTLRSRDSFPGPGKLDFLKKGGKTLDAAVEGDPQNIATRFIRAMNYYQLPVIFNKRGISRSDFQIMVTQMDDPNCPQILSDETRQAICFYAGLSYKQLKQPDQAKIVWENGLKISAVSPLAEKIKKELSRLKV